MSGAGKLLFFVAEDYYFWSHRVGLARAARDAGYEVVLLTQVGKLRDRIEAEGIRVIPLEMSRSGQNPLREANVLRQVIRVYRTERPSLVHHVAMKPVLYGSTAARAAGVGHVINALAGLGFVFSSSSARARVLRPVVRAALRLTLNRPGSYLIVQNPDDAELLAGTAIVSRDRVRLIRGSGVDIEKFSPVPEPEGVPVVMLAARMLRDKGVVEFVEAATRLEAEGVSARFVLVGDPDPANPASIPEQTLRDWHGAGCVEWWGHRDDMPAALAQAHVVCLPSYREGLPKVLLEAAAMGRAIVTTDVPGCREVVRHGYNGLLVAPRDAHSLQGALREVLADREQRLRFGSRGRQRAVEEFAVRRVIGETLALYAEAGGGARGALPEELVLRTPAGRMD